MTLGAGIPIDVAHIISILVLPQIAKLKSRALEYRREISVHLRINRLSNANFKLDNMRKK
jgi:hypothetical protein